MATAWQAVKALPNEAIAFAARGLEAWAVQHCDLSAVVANAARVLEGLGRDGNTRPTDAEHRCQELVRHRERGGVHAVVRHQQPARAALDHRMHAIAGRGLRDEGKHRYGVVAQECSQDRDLLNVLAKAAAFHSHGGARDLNEQPRVRHLKAKVHRDIRHPLVADRGDLDRAAIAEHRERRDHAGVGEVDVRHVVAGLVEGDAELERDRFQVGKEASIRFRRESGEDAVRDTASLRARWRHWGSRFQGGTPR